MSSDAIFPRLRRSFELELNFRAGLQPDAGYGFPAFGVPRFKVGRWHHLSETVYPDRVNRATHLRDESALRNHVDRYVPSGSGSLLK